jgi:uncharacterized MAPEG superfamily protein
MVYVHYFDFDWTETNSEQVQQLKSANNGKWDNVNSRGTETVATYRKSVPAEVYARFERAEAAHKNGFENAPFFIGAVIAGNMAGLSAGMLPWSKCVRV